MISEPVVTPDALKDAITSSPRHVSKGGPMDSIYKSYVFLIQSGFGYYYTWSPFYNPGGDESGRPPEEDPLAGGGGQPVADAPPVSSARPPTTSREIPLAPASLTPKLSGNQLTVGGRHQTSGAQDSSAASAQQTGQSNRNIKKIHVVRSPFVDLPPVRAMRELAPLSTPGGAGGVGGLGVAEDPIALWLKLGALDKLEQALLDGYWEQLVGKTSRIPQVSRFLRQVPAVQARIEEIHEAVVAGRLDLVRGLVEHKKFAYSRDPQGATPLHKAVLYQQPDIISFFLEHYPSTLHARDHQGRTPLHYAAVLEDESEIYDALLDHGADENATDVYGHTPTYYLESDELSIDQLREGVRRSARYREGTLQKASRIKQRESFASNRSFSAKRAGNRSQVREMIRQGNLEVLEELVLHGHGDKLLGESSSDPVVQEFLDTVPGYMEQISDVHRAVVRGRLREVQTLISHKSLSLARDAMGLTPLHKAALFGHYDIAEHLAVNFPASMAAKDLDGRTALHLAAGLRDGQKIYDMLIFAGAPADILDSKGKSAEQYLSHPELLGLEQTIKKNQLANATHLGNTISKLKFLAPNVTKNQSALHDRLLFSSSLLSYERSLGGSESSDATPVTPPSPPIDDGLNNNNNNASNLYLGYLRSMPPQPPPAYRRYSRGRLPPVEIQGEVVTAEKLREWIEDQNVEKLHEAVMSGVADQLAKDHPRDEVIQAYLRHDVPNLMKKFEAIHRALQEGNVPELESQLESQNFALARDHFGMTPLHRAVILNNVASVKFLVNKFPETINARDREGRTALHFAAAMSRRTGKNGMFKYLLQNGADNRIKDNRGRPAEYYKSHHLPIPSEAALLGSRRKLRSKSEPPVRNGFRSQSLLANQISERITTALQKGSVPLAQELVMEGYGKHLIGRTSWNEELRHYLRQVPTQLVSIENVQRAVSTGDVQTLAALSNRDDTLLRARDENGYQAIHMATVNRQPAIVEYIANNYPQYLTAKTPNGRQPLHLAALQKDAEIYRLLVNYGADVRALDARGRTAEFYMRSSGAPKNLATNPDRFYEDYSRRLPAAPLPALGSAFSRKSMPDVNRASRDVRTRTNSESSVVSDQDDHQTLGESEKDKDDEPGDEEIDSGIQSEKGKTPDEEDVNAIEHFADANAKELIDESTRDAAEQAATVEDDADDEPEYSEDSAHEEQAEPHSEEIENAPEEAGPVEQQEDKIEREDEDMDEAEETESNADHNDGENEDEEGDNETNEPTEGEDGDDVEEATKDENCPPQEQDEVVEETPANTDDQDVDELKPEQEQREGAADEGDEGETAANEEEANVEETDTSESAEPVMEADEDHSAEEKQDNAEVDEADEAAVVDPNEAESVATRVSSGDLLKRPPMTPQNSVAGEPGEPPDSAERSLSAIPEMASPAVLTAADTEPSQAENEGEEGGGVDDEENGDPEAKSDTSENKSEKVNSDVDTEACATSPETVKDEVETEDDEAKQDEKASAEADNAGETENESGEADKDETDEKDAETEEPTDVAVPEEQSSNEAEAEQDADKDEGAAPEEEADEKPAAAAEEEDGEADQAAAEDETEKGDGDDAEQAKQDEEDLGGEQQSTAEAENAENGEDEKERTANVEQEDAQANKASDESAKNDEETSNDHADEADSAADTEGLSEGVAKVAGADEVSNGDEMIEGDGNQKGNDDDSNEAKEDHGAEGDGQETSAVTDDEPKDPESETAEPDADGGTANAEAAEDGEVSNVDSEVKEEAEETMQTEEAAVEAVEAAAGENDEEAKNDVEETVENKGEEAAENQEEAGGVDDKEDGAGENKEDVEAENKEDTAAENEEDVTEENGPPEEAGTTDETAEDPGDSEAKGGENGETATENGTANGAEDAAGAEDATNTENAEGDEAEDAAEEKPSSEELNGHVAEAKPEVNGNGDSVADNRAASEAFIENAVLNATKATSDSGRSGRTRSKSRKRKQAARMKAAMDRLNELIDYWIKEEDLLRLEHVVIAGQGERLVGKTSSNPQVQEFLSLVPTYMDKIRQVHQAVIKGDVREVKELLTRKRFALSRDVNGASPLHLSILYGHPDVLKYIVEFFPETLDGPDNEGRTPLHYAAVAPVIDVDYYQVLKNAGADINIKDKNGNSADFYRTHPDVLTIEDIFRNYEHTPEPDDPGLDSNRNSTSGRSKSNERPPTTTPGAPTMGDVKQEVRETVSNMIRELNSEDRGFVEGSGVEAVLVDALIVVCAKRPATPVSFLGDYLLCISAANKQSEGQTVAQTTMTSGSTAAMPGEHKAAAAAQIAINASVSHGETGDKIETLRAEVSKIATPSASPTPMSTHPASVAAKPMEQAPPNASDTAVRTPTVSAKLKQPTTVQPQWQASEANLEQRVATLSPSSGQLPVVAMGPPALMAEPPKTSTTSAMPTASPSLVVVSPLSAASIAISGMAAPLLAASVTGDDSSPSLPKDAAPSASAVPATVSVTPMGPPLSAPVMPLGTPPQQVSGMTMATPLPQATSPAALGSREQTVAKARTTLPVISETVRPPLTEVSTNGGVGQTMNIDRNNGVVPPKVPKVSDIAQAPDVLSDCER